MFKCLECGNYTSLPVCEYCRKDFMLINDVFQLTTNPNIQEKEEEINYISYEQVGIYFGGRDWIKCEQVSLADGKKISEITGNGLMLDVGCGNGYLTVPSVLNGCKVIAGDISNKMVELLLEKARCNKADLAKIIPCRMNALSIPLADNSIDTCIINSVLHLISRPDTVIDEVYRVLKPGGKLLMTVNSPSISDKNRNELKIINKKGRQITNQFYKMYWNKLYKKEITPKKHSWKFDQFKACEKKFGNKKEIYIDHYENREYKLSDYFLYRMKGKGFSDQQHVDDELHEEVYKEVEEEIMKKHGKDFGETTNLHIIDGLKLYCFKKK